MISQCIISGYTEHMYTDTFDICIHTLFWSLNFFQKKFSLIQKWQFWKIIKLPVDRCLLLYLFFFLCGMTIVYGRRGPQFLEQFLFQSLAVLHTTTTSSHATVGIGAILLLVRPLLLTWLYLSWWCLKLMEWERLLFQGALTYVQYNCCVILKGKHF